jgi:hypothetical protein
LEARSLLAQVRRAFELRGKSYDLALLEEAVLLLDEGQTAEVKALAGGLTQVFESKGVHREALAALRLFQEAAERDEATAELARGSCGTSSRPATTRASALSHEPGAKRSPLPSGRAS